MQIFYKDIQYSKDLFGTLKRKYEVYHILGIKIKHRIPLLEGLNNNIFYKENEKLYQITKKEYKKFKDKIRIIGSNNNLVIPKNILENNFNIEINVSGDNNNFVIEPTNYVVKLFIRAQGNNLDLKIGENFSSNGSAINIFGNNISVAVGKDCMFAHNISIITTDFHRIFDNNTSTELNPPQDVIIGNHVWLADSVTIMKGTKIPDNCVVGKNALANKKFSKTNCIIAGIPAKIVKHNIRWER